MPLTYTGRLIERTGKAYPSLVDIAVGLSRQPRFGGHTRQWWSVLDHSLFCDELVKTAGFSGELRLAVLLHDAHEALTGDVPSPLKTDDLREVQRSLDGRIMNAYFPGGFASYEDWRPSVAAIDSRALLAEAHVVGPPVPNTRIVELFGPQNPVDTELLQSLLACEGQARVFGTPWLAIPPLSAGQGAHPGVREYRRRVVALW